MVNKCVQLYYISNSFTHSKNINVILLLLNNNMMEKKLIVSYIAINENQMKKKTIICLSIIHFSHSICAICIIKCGRPF